MSDREATDQNHGFGIGVATLGVWHIHDMLAPMPVLDFQNMQQIQRLTDILGEPECKRLGFLFDDERGVATLTTAGLGYLIDIQARGITSVAEAYAAGYQCGADFHATADEDKA